MLPIAKKTDCGSEPAMTIKIEFVWSQRPTKRGTENGRKKINRGTKEKANALNRLRVGARNDG
jgi:hypothetical protein